MGHTIEQLQHAATEHGRLAAFLDNAHTGTADLTVGARAWGRGPEAQVSVPRAAAGPVVDWAIDAIRRIEVEFGVEPWRAPGAVAGKAEKKGAKRARGADSGGHVR